MPSRLNPQTGRGYRFIDRAGSRNGRLTFTRPIGLSAHNQRIWEAICDCGRITRTVTPKTQSCGCLQREIAGEFQKANAMPPDEKRRSMLARAKRQRDRRKSDPIAVMHARLSRLHRHALSATNTLKTSPTFEMLGYTVVEFVGHIERQFLPRMGWHNMSEWQIDHILPISRAKTVEDVVALNQLTNLRPMWSQANQKKHARREHLI